MAERTVHLLSKRAFVALFTHLITLFAHNGRPFEPVAVDYAKALRTLLSFKPHLEHLDRTSWGKIMGVCWGVALGDRVSIDDEWPDEDHVSFTEQGGPTSQPTSKTNTTLRSVANEIIALIPILLSSSNAPLVPRAQPLHQQDPVDLALGYYILLKVHRYLAHQPFNSVIPLDILRSLNLVLTELELNCKDHFTAASLKIFPQLVAIWTAKGKNDLRVREHVLIAMRMMLPYITHSSVSEQADQEVTGDSTRDSMIKIIDAVGKDAAGPKGVIRPVELETLRFTFGPCKRSNDEDAPPFELTAVAVS